MERREGKVLFGRLKLDLEVVSLSGNLRDVGDQKRLKKHTSLFT